MTPTELNALACRVETETPSEDLCIAVLTAFGWTLDGDWWTRTTPAGTDRVSYVSLPNPLQRLDDAAALMPEGWRVQMIDQNRDRNRWFCALDTLNDDNYPTVVGYAPTEPQARTAAALRARMVEMEGGT